MVWHMDMEGWPLHMKLKQDPSEHYLDKIPFMFMLLLWSHFSHFLLFVTLWTVGRQAPLSMGFSKQEYFNGLLCPPPGDLPDGTQVSCSCCIAAGFFTAEILGKSNLYSYVCWFLETCIKFLTVMVRLGLWKLSLYFGVIIYNIRVLLGRIKIFSNLSFALPFSFHSL